MSDGEFGKFVSVTVHSPDSTKYSSTSFFLHLQQLSHSQKNPVNQKLIQSTVGVQSPGSLGLVLGIVFYINLEIVSLGLETDELKDKLFSHYSIVDTEKWQFKDKTWRAAVHGVTELDMTG